MHFHNFALNYKKKTNKKTPDKNQKKYFDG